MEEKKLSPTELAEKRKELIDYWSDEVLFNNARNAYTESNVYSLELEARRLTALGVIMEYKRGQEDGKKSSDKS